jgi:hypothetical protein
MAAFSQFLADIVITSFGPALFTNQITSNAGFIPISLFDPGPKPKT